MARIEVICGPMFSGKTEELLRRLKRLKYSGTEFLLFKPKIDNRYSEDEVQTHEKSSMKSIPVDIAEEILTICERHPDLKVVAIDETQFFLRSESSGRNLIEVVMELKKMGKRIILNGLDMDFLGYPFGLMPDLLAIADTVSKLKAVCMECGEDANMSYRVDPSKDVVKLGSSDQYQALCFDHWHEKTRKTK